MHDVAEDTNVTLSDLAREFPAEVIEALRLLTHQPGVPYLDYVRSLATNPVARAVKRADLRHNMDETRYMGGTQPPADVLERRRVTYRAALAILEEAEASETVG